MKKVLVVDDTKNIKMLLCKCLEIEGYDVDSASDGKEALELFSRNKYDLAFLDIKLPEVRGTEVLRRIREQGIDTPVIIITAYATVKNAVECTKMGAVAYVQKPFTADKIKSVLGEVFGKKDDIAPVRVQPMNVYEAILKRRSIRKYKQTPIDPKVLEKIVNSARLAPQGANMQPLKYCIINDSDIVNKVFPNVKWAGYIHPEGDPKEGEKPVAYIAILCDTNIKKTGYDVDAGAAGENIILTAVGEGIGSCWLGAIDRVRIGEIIKIPENLVIHSLISLGYPSEDPMVEDDAGSIKYYKDENGVLHVPKRKLEDVMFFNSIN